MIASDNLNFNMPTKFTLDYPSPLFYHFQYIYIYFLYKMDNTYKYINNQIPQIAPNYFVFFLVLTKLHKTIKVAKHATRIQFWLNTS